MYGHDVNEALYQNFETLDRLSDIPPTVSLPLPTSKN